MNPIAIRFVAGAMLVIGVAACSPQATPVAGPAGQPSSTDVNPITGSRGGTNR